MIDPKILKPGAKLELYDHETKSWIPVDVSSVVFDKVELRTLTNERILTTTAEVFRSCRVRPLDGSCRDCGDEAHAGPCEERRCGECGVEISSRCSQHPRAAVHVYRRERWLAEVQSDKPAPTRATCAPLRGELNRLMYVLRGAEEVRGRARVLLKVVDRAEILSVMEDAIRLIDSLPKGES